jgi:hypothetical protein
MRKGLILVFFAFISIAGCRAQENWQDMKNAPPQKRADFQTKMMKEKLALSADQVKKVAVINLKYAEKFQPLIKSDTDRMVKIRMFLTLLGQKDKELQQVFTDKQFAQYKEFEAKIRSQASGHIGAN